MDTLLKNSENIEDLQCGGLKLIQSKIGYRFTTDAVLLANFTRELSGKTCVELGSGSGVVSLLVSHKKHPKTVYAVEIQSELAELTERNVKLNGLQDKIITLCCDMKEAKKFLPELADAVVCNPPYRRIGSGERQIDKSIAVCRHEIKASLSDVLESAASILNNRGALYMVHQSSRMAEIIYSAKRFDLETKEILPVCPRPDKPPNLVLLRLVKGAAPDCILRPPMCILDENGEYTKEAKAYYGESI